MKLLIPGLGNTTGAAGYEQRAPSGGEIKLLNMLRNWKQADISFLTTPGYAAFMASHDIKITFKTLSQSCESSRFGFVTLMGKRLLESLLFRFYTTYDMIYCPSDLLFDVVVSVVYRLRNIGKKLVVCSFLVAVGEPDAPVHPLFSFQQNISYLLMKRFADRVYVLNNYDKEKLAALGFDRSKLFVTSGGYDPAEIAVSSVKRYDAVCIARFHPQKGLEQLVKIWEKVVNIRPVAKLVIIGGGNKDIQNDLEASVRTLNLEKNIIVRADMARKESVRMLRKSRVFLFPSTFESWGFVVAEAMGAGLPVVMYDLAQLKGLFEKGTVKISPFDTEAFARNIVDLLGDNKQYRELSEQARNQARTYTWKHVARVEFENMKKL